MVLGIKKNRRGMDKIKKNCIPEDLNFSLIRI